jgi:hypothetical protein
LSPSPTFLTFAAVVDLTASAARRTIHYFLVWFFIQGWATIKIAFDALPGLTTAFARHYTLPMTARLTSNGGSRYLS